MSDATGHIKVIALPEGEAPLAVRQAWIGLLLPCCPYFGHARKTRGVLSGKENDRAGYAFSVPQKEGIAVLEDHRPKAAAWWKENGFPHEGMYFSFNAEEAEIVSGVKLQKIIVYDDMETGHWRRLSF